MSAHSVSSGNAVRLSVCVATFSRADFLGETLENILSQATDEVEVVVLDGASPDRTGDIVRALQVHHPRLHYHREDVNSGVDHDFDKAVGYARGEYCWLLSDDDLLAPGAIAAVLAAIEDGPELVVVNAEVRDKGMGTVVRRSQLPLAQDRTFQPSEAEQLLVAAGAHLSFIGAVVIRRASWLQRERTPYYGSLFIHVGVLFQPPAIGPTRIITEPLVRIRYGNAMWTPRSFEIWIHKWPRLIWSFEHFSEAARAAVTPRDPARSLKSLLWYRALGAYSAREYRELLVRRGLPHHPLASLVAALPARFANAVVAVACRLARDPDKPIKLYDLERARCASALARRLYRGVAPVGTTTTVSG